MAQTRDYTKKNLLNYHVNPNDIVLEAKLKDNVAERTVVDSVFKATKNVLETKMLSDEARAINDSKDEWNDIGTKYIKQLSDKTIYSDPKKMMEVEASYDNAVKEYDKAVAQRPISATKMKDLQTFLNTSRNSLSNKKTITEMNHQLEVDQTKISFQRAKVFAKMDYGYSQGTFEGVAIADELTSELTGLTQQMIDMDMVTKEGAISLLSEELGGFIYTTKVQSRLVEIENDPVMSVQEKVLALKRLGDEFTGKEMMDVAKKIEANMPLSSAELIWKSLQDKIGGLDSEIGKYRNKLQSDLREMDRTKSLDVMSNRQVQMLLNEGRLIEAYEGVHGKNTFYDKYTSKADFIRNNDGLLKVKTGELYDLNSDSYIPVMERRNIATIKLNTDLRDGHFSLKTAEYMLGMAYNDSGSDNADDIIPYLKQFQTELGISAKLLHSISVADGGTDKANIIREIDDYNTNKISDKTQEDTYEDIITYNKMKKDGASEGQLNDLLQEKNLIIYDKSKWNRTPREETFISKGNLKVSKEYENEKDKFRSEQKDTEKELRELTVPPIKKLLSYRKNEYDEKRYREIKIREYEEFINSDFDKPTPQESLLITEGDLLKWYEENGKEVSEQEIRELKYIWNNYFKNQAFKKKYNSMIGTVMSRRTGSNIVKPSELTIEDVENAKRVLISDIEGGKFDPNYNISQDYRETLFGELKNKRAEQTLINEEIKNNNLNKALGGKALNSKNNYSEDPTKNEWAKKFSHKANIISPAYGVDPIIALAFGIYESKWGTSEDFYDVPLDKKINIMSKNLDKNKIRTIKDLRKSAKDSEYMKDVLDIIDIELKDFISTKKE